MGFFRDQEIRLAMRFLSWQYQKTNKPIPHEVELKKQAAVIVDDAHRIARQRGQNVVSILKQMISDIKK
jgi:undecaprenyl pyrophosphate synthase